MKKTILVYTSPARGHLFPALGVALEMRRRGHEVHVRTLAGEVDRIRALGLGASAMAAAVEAREMDDYKGRSSMDALARGLQAFADRAAHEIDDLRSAIAEMTPDLLLVDTNSWGAQAAAEASGLPWATFQPYFTALPAEGVPPFGPGLPRSTSVAGRLRDKLLNPLILGKVAQTVLPGVNEARARVGLAPLGGMEEFLTRPPLVIYLTAPEFEYPRRAWPDNFRLVGPVGGGSEAREVAWLHEIHRPIVLVTCSTEKQEDLAIMESALAGLPEKGYFVVGTTGAFDPREVAGHGSPHTRVERFIPHEAILGRTAAVVCHGGMGITQKALSHGVPVVVVPFGRDQLEVARRVEHAGAGVRLPARKLDARSVAAAVDRARTMEPGAQRVAAAFEKAGGEVAAADALEELMRSRVTAG